MYSYLMSMYDINAKERTRSNLCARRISGGQ